MDNEQLVPFFDFTHIKGRTSDTRCYSELNGRAGFSPIPVLFFKDPPSLTDENVNYGDTLRGHRKPEEDICPQDFGPYSALSESLKPLYSIIIKYPHLDLDMATRDRMIFESVDPVVWQLRRMLVHVRKMDLQDELKFLELLARRNSDNYLFWYHRWWVSEMIGGVDVRKNELEFTQDILSKDAYNYHAWSHRQWVLQVFGGWEDELSFCGKILEKDSSNSLAWDQRHFVVTKYPSFGGSEAMRDDEVKYSLNAIHAEPENELPWTYLKCILKVGMLDIIEGTCKTLLGEESMSHIKDLKGKYFGDTKRVVNALKMVLYLLLTHDYKPSRKLVEIIDAFCPDKEGYVAKVTSILQSMDMTWRG